MTDADFAAPEIQTVVRRSYCEMEGIRITKKPRLRRASFVNEFFTNGAPFFLETSVPVPLYSGSTNPTEGAYRRLSNIAISTVRKMCACNTARRSTFGLSHLGKGAFRPPLHPPVPGLCPGRPATLPGWTRVHAPGPLDLGGPSCPRPPDLPDHGRIVRPLGRRLTPDSGPVRLLSRGPFAARAGRLGPPPLAFRAAVAVVNLSLTQPEVSSVSARGGLMASRSGSEKRQRTTHRHHAHQCRRRPPTVRASRPDPGLSPPAHDAKRHLLQYRPRSFPH